MKNQSKSSEINKEAEKVNQDVRPALKEYTAKQLDEYAEKEKDLNSKILKITLKINDQYPELSKYLEEMPVTIPDEKNPEITIKNLLTYFDSLNIILNKYILEHSDNKEEKT